MVTIKFDYRNPDVPKLYGRSDVRVKSEQIVCHVAFIKSQQPRGLYCNSSFHDGLCLQCSKEVGRGGIEEQRWPRFRYMNEESFRRRKERDKYYPKILYM
nr:hypothetical protein HmN_000628500 [Hymenolepis microstoma]